MLAAGTACVKGAWSDITRLIWRLMDFAQRTPPEIFLLFYIQNKGFSTIKMYYLRSEKNSNFTNSHGFSKKFAHFPYFCFWEKRVGIFFADILDKKRFSM